MLDDQRQNSLKSLLLSQLALFWNFAARRSDGPVQARPWDRTLEQGQLLPSFARHAAIEFIAVIPVGMFCQNWPAEEDVDARHSPGMTYSGA
jgi:hypothetical protein